MEDESIADEFKTFLKKKENPSFSFQMASPKASAVSVAPERELVRPVLVMGKTSV